MTYPGIESIPKAFAAKEDQENFTRIFENFIKEAVSPFSTPESIEAWQRTSAAIRKKLLSFYMRGHPEGLLEEPPKVEWVDTINTGEGYRIRKLRFEGYPGLWVPALLYEPEGITAPAPVVLNANGHHAGGKAMAYKQARCINLAKRGMPALNYEFLGMGELSGSRMHNSLAHIDMCGVSGVGIFYLIMKRALDVLLSYEFADHKRVAMTGLSGGGWQTVILSALDERITVSVPVAGYSPVRQRVCFRADIGDLEQIPADLCAIADYDTITALIAPRPLLLIYNEKDDCCFRTERTVKSIYKPIRSFYEYLGAGDAIGFHSNTDPGTHNYEADNRNQLYRFLNNRFGLDTSEVDLPFESEIRSEEELNVGLPPDNMTLLGIARAKAVSLAADRGKKAGSEKEQEPEIRRKDLERILRLPNVKIDSYSKTGEIAWGGEVLETGLFSCGKFPPVPCHELGRASSKEEPPVLVIADEGKVGAIAAYTAQSQHRSRRILGLDVLGTGEAGMYGDNVYQCHMLVSTIGLRSLGVQTAQILAAARWLRRESGARCIDMAASGVVSAVACLCACALDPELFKRLETNGLPATLRCLLDWPIQYEEAAPIFCYGLFEQFDIADIAALTGSVDISDISRGPLKAQR